MKKIYFVLHVALFYPLVTLSQQAIYEVTPGIGNGIRFWQSDMYKIHMGNSAEYLFGPVTDYSIKSNMNTDPGRGWTWGIYGQTPILALSNGGHMQLAGNFTTLGNIVLPNYLGSKQIFTWHGGDNNWRIGMSDSPGFSRSLTSSHVQYVAYGGGSQNGFSVGVNGAQSSFEVSGDHRAFFRGNVGIGTPSPASALAVKGRMGIRADAAPTTPTETLRIEGASTADENILNVTNMADQDFIVRLSRVGSTSKRTIIGPSTLNRFSLGVGISNGNEHLTLVAGGNVGIGTISPDQKLTVKGKIHAEEVIIDLSVPAPDYVFEQNYSLTSLDEVQAYIAQHKHLPEVPSAKEMEKDGVKVGEMEMILLKKIEELTLYVLELKSENENLKRILSSEIDNIKSQLAKKNIDEN